MKCRPRTVYHFCTINHTCSSHSIRWINRLWFIHWRHIGEMLHAGKRVYGEPKNLIVAAKSTPGSGTFYRSQNTNWIFLFKERQCAYISTISNWDSMDAIDQIGGVIEESPDFALAGLKELKAHPTTKPTAMIADALRDCSRRGDIVLDPFHWLRHKIFC